MPEERPQVATGTPWSDADDRDLIFAARHAQTMEGIVELLGRTPDEIRERMRELGIKEPEFSYPPSAQG